MLAPQELRQLWQLGEKDTVNWGRKEKPRRSKHVETSGTFQSNQVSQLWWDGWIILVLRHSSLLSLLYLCLYVPPFSIRDGNGRMQEQTCFYTLAGQGWAPSLDFLPFLLPTIRLQTCCSFCQTINRNYES